MAERHWTRRQLLTRAGAAAAGLAGLGLTACSNDPPSATSPAGNVQHFVSRPDLSPPALTTAHPDPGVDAPGYLFVAPGMGGAGQGGTMICDTSGRLVWFSPATSQNRKLDFNRQIYRGRPVLTWFEGEVINGHGEGVGVIADSSYRRTHTVRAGNGLKADLHEFIITPQDTALITAFRTATADLSWAGGPSAGKVLAGVAQEIDIATGRVLFEWDSLDHVDVTETYREFFGGTDTLPFDYFHINSIAVAPDGDLIVSARNTWTVYKINRPSGQIVWRLGGKSSSFSMGPGTHFYWQHDVRPHGSGVLSVFDNGSNGSTPRQEPQSRALFLNLDTTTMRATLNRQYAPPHHLLANAMGNVQLCPDGNVMVGWGTEPYFSEFSADGRLLLDGRLPLHDESYRTFLKDWSGHPAERPAVAAVSSAGGTTVYASWNGATGVHTWAVLAGSAPSSLRVRAIAPHSGFETAIPIAGTGPYFAVEPRDAGRRPLGRSRTVKLATA
jgi:Arylsulfotransferase (ASST)